MKRSHAIFGLVLVGLGHVGMMALAGKHHIRARLETRGVPWAKSRGGADDAEKLAAAEASVVKGKAKATEVYFVGGAGWADQTVFLSEVHAARLAFERRYEAAATRSCSRTILRPTTTSRR